MDAFKTNGDLAESVRPMLMAFAEQMGLDADDRKTAIAGMMTNLMHLCVRDGFDQDAVLNIARRNFMGDRQENYPARSYKLGSEVDVRDREWAFEIFEDFMQMTTIGEIYDTDPDVGTALGLLMPGYEYPDVSGLTVHEVLRRARAANSIKASASDDALIPFAGQSTGIQPK